MTAKVLESLSVLIKFCTPYISNHMICIALFGKHESLKSSWESRNQATIPNHVKENSELDPSHEKYNKSKFVMCIVLTFNLLYFPVICYFT